MRTAAFSSPAPVMPAAWPATHRIRPTKKRIPGTVDGPKHIGYYLEPLRGIASKPDRRQILKDFLTKRMYNTLIFYHYVFSSYQPNDYSRH